LEVHSNPDTAYADAHQTIDVETFGNIVKDARILSQLDGLFSRDSVPG
jgi:3-deoxy-D-arabino-heptulosonate 7-phosphate (DAHP) synthase